MADRYWRGGAGTWNTTLTTNWATTSGAVTGGASVPTASDNVIFDQAGTYTVTMTGALLCANITVSAGTVTFATGTTPTLAVSGSMSLVAATLWNSTGTVTFNATSSQTINNNAVNMDCPITFNGVGGTWTLQSNFAYGKTAIRAMNLTNGTVNGNGFTITSLFASTIATATNTNTLQNISTTLATTVTSGTITANGTFGAFTFTAGSLTLGGALTTAAFTFTAGTLTLSNYTLTCTTFSATGATTRTLAYGTGNITCTGSGTAFTQATPGTLTVTGTPIVNITNAGATATTVASGIVTEAQAPSFNFSGGAYTLTFLGTASYVANNVSFASGWAGTWAATSTGTIYGSLTLSSAMTLTVSTSVLTFGGTVASSKTISPAGKGIPIPLTFNSAGSTYQFTSGMSLGVTTAKAMIFVNGTFDFNNQAITLGFAGSTISMNTNTIAISNVSSSTNIPFTVTSGTCNLTSCNFGGAVTFTAGTLNLLSNTTIGGAFTYTAGTININDYTFTTFTFAATGATTRIIAFGAGGTGNITCNGTGTVWTQATIGTFSYTGTPTINISNPTATAATVAPGIATEVQALNFNFTTGTYALTFLATASYAAKNVDFTGFSGSWANGAVASTIYGNLTLTNTMSTGGTGVVTFGATSGTQIITSNTLTNKDVNFPININGIGGTVKLADSLRITTNLTLTNGTFDANNVGIALTGSNTFTMVTGSVSIKGVTTLSGGFALAFTQTSGTLTQIGDNTFRAFTLTAGTLNLGSYTLTCESFSSSNASTRTIAFGTGNINCTLSGTTWTTATTTGLTVTGTPTVNITYNGGVAVTVLSGILTEANAISFNFTAGNYGLTFLGTVNYSAKNVTFGSGFAGVWNARIVASTIYGSLTLSSASAFSMTSSSGALTFGATSGTQIITTNGKTFDGPITINGVGGTVQLADALTMGSTRAITMTNGTFDGNSKTISSTLALIMITGSVVAKGIITNAAITHTSGTLTQGGTNSVGAYTLTAGSLNLSGYILTTTAFATGVGTKDLTFNGGTLTITNATTTAFNNVNPLNFTTTAGTGTGKISMTAATAKTFVGGGSTYNCTLSNDGAGTLTITGANTFTKLANGVQPTAFVFPSSTTTTVSDFGIDGTAGNLVTITSSTSGTAATLSSATSRIDTYYISLKDNAATGGAVWTAYNSTNVSGNTGWIFSINSGNFFAMFF